MVEIDFVEEALLLQTSDSLAERRIEKLPLLRFRMRVGDIRVFAPPDVVSDSAETVGACLSMRLQHGSDSAAEATLLRLPGRGGSGNLTTKLIFHL